MLTREALATGEAIVTTVEDVRMVRDRAVAVAIADLTTLHPAAEWTEADGAVLWWATCGSTPYVAARQFVEGWDFEKLPSRKYPYWSRIPQVQLPAKPKEAK